MIVQVFISNPMQTQDSSGRYANKAVQKAYTALKIKKATGFASYQVQ
jgi:hypothetical protein